MAIAEERVVGQIEVKRHWNRFAFIEDVKVDRHFRRHGIGRKLMNEAARWARDNGLAGMMLETQTNNVKACQFYESCGFAIGGFDSNLYKAIPEHADKVAVYWYLTFPS